MHGLEITDVVTQSRTPCSHTGEQTIMRGPAAQHAPEAFDDVELRAITRQPGQTQVWMSRSDLLHPRPTMPGGIIDGDHDLRGNAYRIRACNISEVRGKSRLQPQLFALSRPRLAVRWLLEHTRRQLTRHQIERRTTIDLILVIPGAYDGPLPLHAEGGVERRDERKARFILAQQHARPRVRFFFNVANSS